MRIGHIVAACGVLLLIIANRVAAAAEPAQAGIEIPRVLRADERLQAPAPAIRARSQPLSDLVATLGKRADVRLSAARGEVADEKVTLALRERPLAEVLALLGEHYGYYWVKEGEGYEITQDLTTRNRDAAARQATADAAWERTRQIIAEVGPLAAQPPEALAAARAEIEPRLLEPSLAGDERRRLLDRLTALDSAARPGAALVAAFFSRLQPAHLQSLRRGEDVLLTSVNGTVAPSFAQAILQQLPASPTEQRLPLEVRVTARWRRWRGGPTVVGARSVGPPRLEVGFQVAMGRTPGDIRSLIWSTAGGREIRAERRTSTTDPQLRATVEPQRPDATSSPGGPDGPYSLADLLFALADATPFEFIADGYVRARYAEHVFYKRPLVEMLDLAAHGVDYDWSREGNLIRLQSRTRPDDRAAEVPERVLRPYRERMRETGAISLDDLAALAGPLEDERLRTLDAYWPVYFQGTRVTLAVTYSSLFDERHHLRFWRQLTAAQKEALRGGQPLPAARLTPAQRRSFTDAFMLQPTLLGLASGLPLPTPTELSNAELALDERDTTLRELAPAPPGMPPTARQIVERPAIAYTFRYQVPGDPRPRREMLITLQRPRPTPPR